MNESNSKDTIKSTSLDSHENLMAIKGVEDYDDRNVKKAVTPSSVGVPELVQRAFSRADL